MSSIEELEYCPVCEHELSTYKIVYPKYKSIFKTDKEILEVQKYCTHCGWSTWTKQEQ